MGSLKNGHVFANMLSFPRLGLMGDLPLKSLELSCLCAWIVVVGQLTVWKEKVFALVVVFGEKKCSLRLGVS